jgi:predicted phosphodiesterase
VSLAKEYQSIAYPRSQELADIPHELSAEFETLEIYPLSDVHIGDPLLDEKRLYKFRDEILEQPNRYIICNGDLINNATANSVSDHVEEVYRIDEQIAIVAQFLEPVKDRILVMHEGNHEKRSYRYAEIWPTWEMARQLRITPVYSRFPYILYLKFGKQRGKRTDRKAVYTLFGKHGTAGGRRPGSKLNNLQDMAGVVDADIYLQSHTHTPIAHRDSYIRLNTRNNKKMVIEKLYINSGSFVNYGGYGSEHGYRPTSTKYPKIILHAEEKLAEAIL